MRRPSKWQREQLEDIHRVEVSTGTEEEDQVVVAILAREMRMEVHQGIMEVIEGGGEKLQIGI